jgi:hypothetical protein
MDKQKAYWRRVRYVPVSGYGGYVSSWPIYNEAKSGESFSTRAQRFVDVIARVDPNLQTASMQGLNALSGAAHPGGIVLCALGLGIYHLWDLLRNPMAWKAQLERLEQEYPETVEAIDDLRMLAAMSDRDRLSQLMSLRSKLRPLRLDPTFKAVFGGTTPSINWGDVVAEKQAVLIDFRGMTDEMKKFCLLWVYNSFLTFIKDRGHTKMHDPISFIIDELSYLVGTTGTNAELLTADLNELVNQISRSHGLWVTLATQELFQLPPKLRQTVLSVGTVLLGQTSDQQQAEELARRYMPYDPYLVKDARPIYTPVMPSQRGWDKPTVVQSETSYTYFTKDEQIAKNSWIFRKLEKFHFLIGQSKREGELPTSLNEISIENLDPNQYQERAMTDPIRASLARRDGQKVRVLLEEIDQQSGAGIRKKPGEHTAGRGTDAPPTVSVHQSPANPVRKPPITRRPVNPQEKNQ